MTTETFPKLALFCNYVEFSLVFRWSHCLFSQTHTDKRKYFDKIHGRSFLNFV